MGRECGACRYWHRVLGVYGACIVPLSAALPLWVMRAIFNATADMHENEPADMCRCFRFPNEEEEDHG